MPTAHLFCIYHSFQMMRPLVFMYIFTAVKNITIFRPTKNPKFRYMSYQGLVNLDFYEVNLKGNGKQSKPEIVEKQLFFSTYAFTANKFSLGNRD